MTRQLTDRYADRLAELLQELADPRPEMRYAESRLIEAGLASGSYDRDDVHQFAHDLLRANLLLPDYFRLIKARDPERMESVEELIDEIAAQSHLE